MLATSEAANPATDDGTVPRREWTCRYCDRRFKRLEHVQRVSCTFLATVRQMSSVSLRMNNLYHYGLEQTSGLFSRPVKALGP